MLCSNTYVFFVVKNLKVKCREGKFAVKHVELRFGENGTQKNIELFNNVIKKGEVKV